MARRPLIAGNWKMNAGGADACVLAASVAIVLATVNMVGGFVVTDRMLQMFTRKKPAKAAVDAEKVEGR